VITVAPPYGSDRSGLIAGFLFQPDHSGQPLDSAAAAAWLQGATPADAQGFAWLHFNLANAATERWLRQHLAPAEGFFDELHEGSRSTRIEFARDGLMAVLNDVVYEFDFEPSQISTLWMWVDRRTLVSARLHPLCLGAARRQAGAPTLTAFAAPQGG
jgi:zinc transporter